MTDTVSVKAVVIVRTLLYIGITITSFIIFVPVAISMVSRPTCLCFFKFINVITRQSFTTKPKRFRFISADPINYANHRRVYIFWRGSKFLTLTGSIRHDSALIVHVKHLTQSKDRFSHSLIHADIITYVIIHLLLITHTYIHTSYIHTHIHT